MKRQLLLINGWSASARLWQGLTTHLPEGWTLTVIDLDRQRSLASWLAHIDQWVTPNTLLVGWSLGGTLVMHYAAITKKPFLGLCTLQSNPCFVARDDWSHGMSRTDFEQFYALVEGDRRDQLVQQFAHLMVVGSDHCKADKRHLKTLYDAALLPEKAVLLSGLDLLRKSDARKDLSRIGQPCLHVYGSADALVPNDLVADLQLIAPGHRFVTIQGMGHLPCLGYVSVVKTCVMGFAASHDC